VGSLPMTALVASNSPAARASARPRHTRPDGTGLQV